MNALVACEESQAICIALRRRGYNAFSCDIQECSGNHPEWHIVGDCLPLLNGNCSFTTQSGEAVRIDGQWDLLIGHPPCTFLSKAGSNRLIVDGKLQEDRYEKGLEARSFFMKFIEADCRRIAIENPIPIKLFKLPPYSQIIQPFYFGDPYYKTTCLWLKGLPPLFPTCLCEPIGKWVNCTDHRARKKSDDWAKSGVRSAKDRAKTFPGIADAIADQWGDFVEKHDLK